MSIGSGYYILVAGLIVVFIDYSRHISNLLDLKFTRIHAKLCRIGCIVVETLASMSTEKESLCVWYGEHGVCASVTICHLVFISFLMKRVI
ncbi:hypothetical protein BDY19DRAFT_941639 [Irpex rosettiformis]|uniref:Uncharacterized protein n=1 Tax=Irpex rosettiformis TaxID=378272 RepID=A0ACB8U758_9APHY|nr:hypothetical protein BDY19DRAFT_941639 [Irpex rosettiformis]